MVPSKEAPAADSRLERMLEPLRRHPNNVPFQRLLRVLRSLGFELHRQRGSHMIFKRDDASPRIKLQREGTLAKPYHVRQVLRAAEHGGEGEP